MRIIKTRSGRRVILQDHETPKDFGYAFQRELLESFDRGRVDSIFSTLAFMAAVVVVIFVLTVLAKNLM